MRYVFNRLNRGSYTYVESPPTSAPASRRIIDLGTSDSKQIVLSRFFWRLLPRVLGPSSFPRVHLELLSVNGETGRMECSKNVWSLLIKTACVSFNISIESGRDESEILTSLHLRFFQCASCQWLSSKIVFTIKSSWLQSRRIYRSLVLQLKKILARGLNKR